MLYLEIVQLLLFVSFKLIHETSELNLIILVYILIEYSDNYSKISEGFWYYHIDEKTFNNDIPVAVTAANSEQF